MFSNILGKISGNDSSQNKELIEKISKMNLVDMKTYINNRIPEFFVDEDGLSEIMRKLIRVDANTDKRYIEINSIDSKIKKCFDLVLTILINKKITITTIELVNEFVETYKDIIEKYDKENKQIYSSKFQNAINLAINDISKMADLKRKMEVVGS